jgi:hypothetical protein
MTRQPWEDDERRNWEYGDIRLRAVNHLYAGGSLQAIVLRGQLLLEYVVTRLLAKSTVAPSERALNKTTFSRKIQLAAQNGIIDEQMKNLLITINRLRNTYAHEATNTTFRQVRAFWKAAEATGVSYRFHSLIDGAVTDEQVDTMGELADELFHPEHELVDLLAELFSHLVFWNYDSFDIGSLMKMKPDSPPT